MTIRRHLAAGILGLLVTLSAVVVSAGQAVDAGSDASFPVVDRVTSPAINQAWNRLQELVALAARLDQPSLMGLSGTLEQASVVARPLVEGGGGVGEWFIRTSDGSTIACAVQEPPTPSPSPGTIVELVGFPAGMLEATGRDGVVRSWPLFTSRFTGVVTAPSSGSPLPYIVGGVLLPACRVDGAGDPDPSPGSRRDPGPRSGGGGGGGVGGRSPERPGRSDVGAGGPARIRIECHGVARMSNAERLELELPGTPFRSSMIVGRGLLSQAGDLLREEAGRSRGDRVHLMIDRGPGDVVATRHGAVLEAALRGDGAVSLGLVEATESNKSIDTIVRGWDQLAGAGIDRRGWVVGLGGGILLCDVAGYLASSWMRGVRLALAPTTLLAMVDAGLGGKTGINRPLPDGGLGKNLVGAFWPARLVLCDTDTLETLGEREFRAGLAECVKHGLIAGEETLAALDQELPAVLARDPDAMPAFVARCAAVKADVVRRDFREGGERALLNLGHTLRPCDGEPRRVRAAPRGGGLDRAGRGRQCLGGRGPGLGRIGSPGGGPPPGLRTAHVPAWKPGRLPGPRRLAPRSHAAGQEE